MNLAHILLFVLACEAMELTPSSEIDRSRSAALSIGGIPKINEAAGFLARALPEFGHLEKDDAAKTCHGALIPGQANGMILAYLATLIAPLSVSSAFVPEYPFPQPEPDENVGFRSEVVKLLKEFKGTWQEFNKDGFFAIQSFDDTTEKEYLEDDVWASQIFPLVDDFIACTRLCQVNKSCNFLFRTRFFIRMVMLAKNENEWAFYKEPGRAWSRGISHKLLTTLKTLRAAKDRKALTALRLEAYERCDSLYLIADAYKYTLDPQRFPLIPVEAMNMLNRNLIMVMGTNFHQNFARGKVPQYIWLPEIDDDIPLMHLFEPRTLAAISNVRLILFRGMFLPHIIAQYIIPAYHEHGDSTGMIAELQPVNVALGGPSYSEYFQYLYRALFLLDPEEVKRTGSKHKDSDMASIHSFLQRIGFRQTVLSACHPPGDVWDDEAWNREEEMWSVFRAAQHWGLDWKLIAKKTRKWCKLSRRILKGEIPEGLDPDADITPQDVFKVAFWSEANPHNVEIETETGIVFLKQDPQEDGSRKRRRRVKAESLVERKARQKRAVEVEEIDEEQPNVAGNQVGVYNPFMNNPFILQNQMPPDAMNVLVQQPLPQLTLNPMGFLAQQPPPSQLALNQTDFMEPIHPVFTVVDHILSFLRFAPSPHMNQPAMPTTANTFDPANTQPEDLPALESPFFDLPEDPDHSYDLDNF